MAPSFDEVFYSCKWVNSNETCSNLFSPMLTEDGICFTFNMLDRRELFTDDVYFHGDYMNQGRTSEGWTIDENYPKDAKKSTFPKRAMSAGSKNGLILELKAYERHLDYACRGPLQGFKILLHHSAEVPRVGTQFFRAPYNHEIVVAVKPDMMTTSAGLKNYNPRRRQCFFSQERQPRFFQIYTQQNCQSECLTNYTLARCGCVAYHMPHIKSTKICESGSISCISDAEHELLNREINSEISNYDSNYSDDAQTICDCLPSCLSITYNVETSHADYNWAKFLRTIVPEFNRNEGRYMTKLSIYFRNQQFFASERNELYGQTDFLANCGGLLGLFTGFSFLSIVEIVYFLSLRLMCNIRKYGEHFWSGSIDLVNDKT